MGICQTAKRPSSLFYQFPKSPHCLPCSVRHDQPGQFTRHQGSLATGFPVQNILPLRRRLKSVAGCVFLLGFTFQD